MQATHLIRLVSCIFTTLNRLTHYLVLQNHKTLCFFHIPAAPSKAEWNQHISHWKTLQYLFDFHWKTLQYNAIIDGKTLQTLYNNRKKDEPMLYRKAKKKIEDWLVNGKDALLVTGARQVGKSFLIRETLKEKNIDFVEFNFIKQKDLIPIFDSAINQNANKFLFELRIAAKKQLSKNTVIFFDEIQEIKEIVTIIKFLVEDGEYKFILSGSFLGIELTNLRSAPVGYLTTIDMYPLDLEEFFIANGLQSDVLSELKDDFVHERPVSNFVHEALMDTFYTYLIIGGMPEAVQEYVDTQDPMRVAQIHNSIVREYKKDFTKYEKEKKLTLIKTYDLIPSELDSKNKRYQFSDISPNVRYNRYENSFNWLIDAGVALPVFNVTEFEFPLAASKKSNLFKLFLSDVGMLTTLYGPTTALKLSSRGKDINCGAIFENFVAQELNSKGFKTYYFNSKKHGEVDFLIEYKNTLLPIEVKSGKDYTVRSALSYFMTTEYFEKGIVFSNYNVKREDNIIYLPIYMTMFLTNEINLEKLKKIDLSKLSNESKN